MIILVKSKNKLGISGKILSWINSSSNKKLIQTLQNELFLHEQIIIFHKKKWCYNQKRANFQLQLPLAYKKVPRVLKVPKVKDYKVWNSSVKEWKNKIYLN